MDFKVAHEQRVHVQLLAQAVHGNEIEMEIEFGEVEDFHRQCAARPVRGLQSVGDLPDSLLEGPRVGPTIDNNAKHEAHPV